jgi:hypothetical protein
MKNFLALISILEEIKNEKVVRMEFKEYLLTKHRPASKAQSQLIPG